MRLIDADELKKMWCANCDNRHLCGDNAGCDDVKELYDMPTIEAEPTKHGRWKFTFRGMRAVPVDADITCSVCGATFNRTHGTRFLRCPNCGADMREVEE